MSPDRFDLLADRLAERVSAQVTEQILPLFNALLERIEAAPNGASLTAAEVAERLGVDRKWIYGHAAELGARRLPSAKGQGRLRFDPEAIEQAVRRLQSAGPADRKPKPRKQTEAAANVELLPIRAGESR